MAGNKTVADALKKAKKQRNYRRIALVGWRPAWHRLPVVSPSVVGPALGEAGIFAGHERAYRWRGDPVIAFFAIRALIGLMTYNTVKAPLHWVERQNIRSRG